MLLTMLFIMAIGVLVTACAVMMELTEDDAYDDDADELHREYLADTDPGDEDPF